MHKPEPKMSCCIKDYCGLPFDQSIPETRDPKTLVFLWQWYCPKHRVDGKERIIIVAQESNG